MSELEVRPCLKCGSGFVRLVDSKGNEINDKGRALLGYRVVCKNCGLTYTNCYTFDGLTLLQSWNTRKGWL